MTEPMSDQRRAEIEELAREWWDPAGPDCPYWLRYTGAEGHDPEAICGGGCHDEPSCITDSWPAAKTPGRVLAEAVYDMLAEVERLRKIEAAARRVARHFGSRFSGPVLSELADALGGADDGGTGGP